MAKTAIASKAAEPGCLASVSPMSGNAFQTCEPDWDQGPLFLHGPKRPFEVVAKGASAHVYPGRMMRDSPPPIASISWLIRLTNVAGSSS